MKNDTLETIKNINAKSVQIEAHTSKPSSASSGGRSANAIVIFTRRRTFGIVRYGTASPREQAFLNLA